MELSEKVYKLYQTIDLYNRYKELSYTFDKRDDSLEKTDKKVILDIFENLGYSAKYTTREKFYSIEQKKSNEHFYLHISLKYGIVELIFGPTDDYNGEEIGGTVAGICKLIEHKKNEITEGYLKNPAFTNYEELEEILKIMLNLFEDFKNAFYSAYNN